MHAAIPWATSRVEPLDAHAAGPRSSTVPPHLSFAEFHAVVERTAAALVDAGFPKGSRLAILSRNCWQFAVLNFATARAGVVFVPLNFMLGAAEIAYLLDVSGAIGFVVEDSLIPVADAALTQSTGRVSARLQIRGRAADPRSGWTDLQDWLDHEGAAPEVDVVDDDPIRMMFTSGTESRPKGILLSSRSLLWQYVSCAVDGGMSADDVEVHAMPLYHCAQLDCFLGTDIYLGATSIIVPGPEPRTVLRAIEKHRATKLFAPPTVWIGLLRSPAFDRPHRRFVHARVRHRLGLLDGFRDGNRTPSRHPARRPSSPTAWARHFGTGRLSTPVPVAPAAIAGLSSERGSFPLNGNATVGHPQPALSSVVPAVGDLHDEGLSIGPPCDAGSGAGAVFRGAVGPLGSAAESRPSDNRRGISFRERGSEVPATETTGPSRPRRTSDVRSLIPAHHRELCRYTGFQVVGADHHSAGPRRIRQCLRSRYDLHSVAAVQ
ncbi:AMP-binding protein [Nocardia sp. NPDC050193]